MKLAHGVESADLKRILILGGGFGDIEVLKKLQKEFQNNAEIDITLVSNDNYFFFTPMLHEISTGAIETRHIITSIKTFCKRTRFYEAHVKSIDLNNKTVTISYQIGKNNITDTETLKKFPLVKLQSSSDSSIPHSESNRIINTIDKQYHALNYDYLVIALGSETKYFGIESMKKNSFAMRTLDLLFNHDITRLKIFSKSF